MKTKYTLPWLALVFAVTAQAQKLSPLASAPDWSRLDQFQETITRAEFSSLWEKVYALENAGRDVIEINDDFAAICKTVSPKTIYTLRFAKNDAAKKVPRYWKPAKALPSPRNGKPLSGLKIAIDPGHLGGKWAKVEERWFQIGESKPVVEGDMALLVAKILAPKLRALGAEVLLVRNSAEPITGRRPVNLRGAAIRFMKERGIASISAFHKGADDPAKEQTIQWQAERLFYRVSEIRARAKLVNENLRPDLTLCLHFNAEQWGDPKHPRLVEKNHLHVIVNGCYSAEELSFDDVRFEMMMKLLTRCYPEELAVSEKVATAMHEATQLPFYEYPPLGNSARVEGANVWMRNLLANRLYRNPVVYIEPYVMNSQEVFDRVQAGDYVGEKMVGGKMQRSIYREYADGVTEGLRSYYDVRTGNSVGTKKLPAQ